MIQFGILKTQLLKHAAGLTRVIQFVLKLCYANGAQWSGATGPTPRELGQAVTERLLAL